jgi:thioester reductase-like protein
MLAEIWSAVLGRPADPDLGFFEQGGDSLGVLEVAAAAHARGLTIPPALVAEGRTVREIAAWLREGTTTPGAMPAVELEADAAAVLRAQGVANPGRCPGLGAPSPSGWDPSAHPEGVRAPSPGQRPGSNCTVLLTGATGFLGSWLLPELLSRTTAEVVCLVRGTGRVQPHPRVREVLGDLEKPSLGLASADWEELADRVDTVYHCAAAVNVVLPYDRLRPANLLGTAEVLRLLAAGRPKRLHYASTLSVFVATDRNHGSLREDDDLTQTRLVYGGYAQTKWAAERLLRLAGGRCGPVAHYRLGLITGDTRTGRSPGRDFLTLFLRGLARLGGYPAGVEGKLFIDITPVDYAAAAMAALSLGGVHPDGTTFHVANPRTLSLDGLVGALKASGVRLDALGPDEFRERVRSLDPEAAAACLGLCRAIPGEGFDRLRTADLFQATGVTFDQRNTLAGLAGTGVECPPPSPDLLAKYVAAALPNGVPR